jgi:hypothetical protein
VLKKGNKDEIFVDKGSFGKGEVYRSQNESACGVEILLANHQYPNVSKSLDR